MVRRPAQSPAAAAPSSTKKPKMVENNQPMHHGMHDLHDAMSHFDNEVHDQWPQEWTPPGALDAPPARPNMVQRWIRTDLVGKADAKNVANQSRQGWRPRPFSSIPAGERSKFPSVQTKSLGEVIKQGDLVLCEMPRPLFEQKRAYYRSLRQRQVQSLVQSHISDHNLRAEGGDAFGPITMSRKTKVGVRQPIAASDE
jgi:hypothetical protein